MEYNRIKRIEESLKNLPAGQVVVDQAAPNLDGGDVQSVLTDFAGRIKALEDAVAAL